MRSVLILLCMLLVTNVTSTAVASDAEGLQRALAKAKHLLRSMQKENQALKAEKAALDKDLSDAQADLAELSKQKKTLEKKLDQSMTTNDRLSSRLGVSEARREEAYERVEKLSERLREHIEVLKRTIGQRNVLEVNLEDANSALQDCEFKNMKLYEANVEMAERYENKGTTKSVLQREPFTGLKQVEIETILEEYQRKIEAFRVAERKAD